MVCFEVTGFPQGLLAFSTRQGFAEARFSPHSRGEPLSPQIRERPQAEAGGKNLP